MSPPLTWRRWGSKGRRSTERPLVLDLADQGRQDRPQPPQGRRERPRRRDRPPNTSSKARHDGNDEQQGIFIDAALSEEP